MSQVELTQVDKFNRQITELESERELAELQDEFVAKKLARKATAADRLALHEARQEHRLHHRRAIPGAAPATIGAEASQGEVG